MSSAWCFKALFLLAISTLAFSLIQGIAAQDSDSSGSTKVFRNSDSAVSDKPSGRVSIRLIDGDDSSIEDKLPPAEDNNTPPAEPGAPASEDDRPPPDFFGEPLRGRFVWVLDVSWSMGVKDVGSGEDYDGNTVTGASRIQIVKFETVKVLKELSETDFFDFILLAGADDDSTKNVSVTSKPVTDVWQGELAACDDTMKATAIQYVKDLTCWWGTPTYQALERATHDYGEEIDKLLFLTDGAPYPNGQGVWGTNHMQAILDDFPGWYAPLKSYGCELLCFHVGNNQGAGTFMQDFASQNGGQYIKP